MKPLTQEDVAQVAELFRLLGEPNRLRLVVACLEGSRGVGGIAEELDLSQSLVSHHLRLLRTARILRAERRGRQVCYALADAHVDEVVRNMIAHIVEPHAHDSEPEVLA